MNRSLLVPASALTLLSFVAPCVRAGDPSYFFSTVPSVIRLVGASASGPDATAGRFTVVVRDLASNGLNNAEVRIDLSHSPEFVLCSDQMDPDALTNCAAKTVKKWTNAQGEVTFTLLGASHGAPQSLANTLWVYANGVRIRTPSVAAFDLDGSGGVGASDLAIWLTDFASGIPWSRSDYDGDGNVGAADLSEWLTVFGAGGSASSCGAACP